MQEEELIELEAKFGTFERNPGQDKDGKRPPKGR